MPKAKDEQKIDRIFEATLKLVVKNGFSGLKMSEVAKEAEIATGTLYIYFKDKHELINALYLHLKKQKTAMFIDNELLKLPTKACFDELWKRYFTLSLNNPEEAAFLEQYYRSPFLDIKVKEEAYLLLKPVYEVLEKGKQEQIIKDVETEILIASIIGSINEYVNLHHSNTLLMNEKNISFALQMAWDAIKK